MTEVTTGADAAPGELRDALFGFVAELKGFRQDIHDKLDAQENRMSMFERKTALRNRTPLSVEAEVEVPHQKAFNAYLRCGDDSAMRGLDLEAKAISADGAVVAGPTLEESVRTALSGSTPLRALANVVQVEGPAYEVLVDSDDLMVGWGNGSSVDETGGGNFVRTRIDLHELSAAPRASQRVLDDAAFDVEAWLATAIAGKFARAETAAFLTGSGFGQPQGILNGNMDPTGAGSPGEVGLVKTGTDGDFNAADPAGNLIDLVYSLSASARANATFLMNSKTAAAVRKLKDADGRFIWTDGLAAGEPARLLGYPVVTCEDMPEIASDSISVLFGDFRQAYTIVERPELRVLRDPYSAKPHVIFYATKRIGGGLVDGRAMRALQFGA